MNRPIKDEYDYLTECDATSQPSHTPWEVKPITLIFVAVIAIACVAAFISSIWDVL